MQKRVFIFSFIFIIIIFLLFIIDSLKFLYTPVIPKDTQIDYLFPSGASVKVLTDELNQLGLLHRPVYFELLAYLRGDARHLHAGEYRFEAGTTPAKLLRQISEGRVLWRPMTFIEGWTFYQIRVVLDRNALLQHELTGLSPVMIMSALRLRGIYPEGLFFPDTYLYTAGMSDKAILGQASRMLHKHLSMEWQHRAENLPYQTPYEALIAASIIEKEAHVNSERARIAGVIVRRLEKHMPLQMDPTVIYALGENFKPPLQREALKTESLYNTYLHIGLPPTPICMPGLASLHAALHPDNSDALYFVARRDGTHQFSATYQAHKEAIAKYELKVR